MAAAAAVEKAGSELGTPSALSESDERGVGGGENGVPSPRRAEARLAVMLRQLVGKAGRECCICRPACMAVINSRKPTEGMQVAEEERQPYAGMGEWERRSITLSKMAAVEKC